MKGSGASLRLNREAMAAVLTMNRPERAAGYVSRSGSRYGRNYRAGAFCPARAIGDGALAPTSGMVVVAQFVKRGVGSHLYPRLVDRSLSLLHRESIDQCLEASKPRLSFDRIQHGPLR